MSTILYIENLEKSFGGVTPIKGLSLSVKFRDIILISGENGTGKTTLFNLISGLEDPSEGKIFFKNNDITNEKSLSVAQKGISRLYQHPRIFKNLLVWENLVAAANQNIGENVCNLIFNYLKAKKIDSELKTKAIELLSDFGLQSLTEEVAGQLSYGQQKLISFCMLMMNNVKLALLDEPFAGLNPQTVEVLNKMVKIMEKQGVTFMIIEHNTSKALKICNRHLEMKNGIIYSLKDYGNDF